MKKVAVVWSSPNLDGLTAQVKNQFISGLKNGGTDVEEIHLNSLSVSHCKACGNGWGTCASKGTCVINDDFSDVYEKLKNVDGIVWISAVYWSDTTEAFKALFDRLRRCDAMKNRSLAGKRCILIAVAGGTGNGTIECLTQMERGLSHMGMRAYDRIPVVRYNRSYTLPMLQSAGKVYAETLDGGFNMYY